MWYNTNMEISKKMGKLKAKIKDLYGILIISLVLIPFHFSLGATIENPLGATRSLPALIETLVSKVVIPVGVPIATLFLVYSGFLFVKAQGRPEELTKAKETFMWTIIGIAILLGAWVLSAAIQATIIQLGSGV